MKDFVLWRLPVGKYLGIPVFLHWSWLLMVLAVSIVNWQWALIVVGVFFVILLHEFGHCAAALMYGHKAQEITLTPLGGIAVLDVRRITHWQEFVIALAGPVVNVVLAIPLVYLGTYHFILSMIAVYNVVIFLFNMIPCFPMDGGRLLRAGLSMIFGDLKGTYYAVRIGQVIGCLFCIIGLVHFNLTLPIIGLLAIFYAENELQNKRMQATFTRIADETKDMSPTDALAHTVSTLKENEPWIYKLRSIEERRIRDDS